MRIDKKGAEGQRGKGAKCWIADSLFRASQSPLLFVLCASAPLWCSASVSGQQSHFWIQHGGESSERGTAGNPVINVRAGQQADAYIWFSSESAPNGFDGVSLDIRLTAAGTARASVTLDIDTPEGRWTGVTGGVARQDSGGQGVDDANAFDLTNTDTLDSQPMRFGKLTITGEVAGSVQLKMCIGEFGIADGGENAVVWLGFAQGSTSAETLNISGGLSGLCSQVADATINVVPRVGDFDNDGDVDQTDFGRLQACLSGSAVPQSDPNCSEALLDDDADVDQNDFQIFIGCMTGANVPVDPACAD